MIRNLVIVFIILTLGAIACTDSQLLPPTADRINHITEIHDKVLTDPYYWLRDIENEKVIEYLEAENRYSENVAKSWAGLEDELYNEMLERSIKDDSGVPEKLDEYYYYSRRPKESQYRIYCRTLGTDGKEEILLDLNTYAEKYEYVSLGSLKPSPCHNYLAFSIDKSGSEEYCLFIKDLSCGTLCNDSIPMVDDFEWGRDKSALYYTAMGHDFHTDRLYRHEAGLSYLKDRLLYTEEEKAFYIGLEKEKDNNYIYLNCFSSSSSECYLIDLSSNDSEPELLAPRADSLQYYIRIHNETVYKVSNDNAPDFRLQAKNTRDEGWIDILPPSDSLSINDIDFFNEYITVYCHMKGLPQILVINSENNERYFVDFSREIYDYWPGANKGAGTYLLRMSVTTLDAPATVWDYDLSQRKWILKKEYKAGGNYDKNQYESHRIFCTADDGTEIPISILHEKDIELNGENPLLLEGYGAYGSCADIYFSTSRISLLERGFVYAIAHIRGGGEYGDKWHDMGKMLSKKNTFSDFISCAECLIERGYTNENKLAVTGGSAGGLLIGAVLNMQPDLFAAAVLEVPFLDAINTMLDDELPLTIGEYEEWGNPNEKTYFDYILSYSPYDNIKDTIYPHMLVTAGLNDPRVGYWEAAKYVAKLRYGKKDENMLILKTNMGSGHFGASGYYDYYRETAFTYAFILNALEIEKNKAEGI